MSYETVHTIGYTAYFVLLLLFVWMSNVPRTNPGAGWWALALVCSLVSRVTLYLLLPADDLRLPVTVYALSNVIEKPLLLTGLIRFLNLPSRLLPYWLATAVVELGVIVAWFAGIPALTVMLSYSIFSGAVMMVMARLSWAPPPELPRWPLRVVSVASAVMAVHWLTATTLIQHFPSWFRNGYFLGTVLMLTIYLSLMIAVVKLFQHRLLDAEAKAMDLALLDPLTGLNNKRYMNNLFDHALLLATRPHHLVAIFYIDLDNFKQINDLSGHAVGDEVLKEVASRLRNNTRSTDICARIGGDEFIVIGTQLETEAQAGEVANKLLLQLKREMIFDNQPQKVGASIGISLFPRDGTCLAELIDRADKAMYRVKHSGKDGIQLYRREEPVT